MVHAYQVKLRNNNQSNICTPHVCLFTINIGIHTTYNNKQNVSITTTMTFAIIYIYIHLIYKMICALNKCRDLMKNCHKGHTLFSTEFVETEYSYILTHDKEIINCLDSYVNKTLITITMGIIQTINKKHVLKTVYYVWINIPRT